MQTRSANQQRAAALSSRLCFFFACVPTVPAQTSRGGVAGKNIDVSGSRDSFRSELRDHVPDPAPLTEKDVYREFGYTRLHDGVRLAYVIWRPTKEGRYPVVFHYSPYGSDAAQFRDVKRFLDAGYAYLGVNMRGTGCSEGVDVEGGGARPATVGRDGAEVVEWAAAQAWSTGGNGMIGNSYAGDLQLATAANHPPHLKAITAIDSAGVLIIYPNAARSCLIFSYMP
jgi:predicted acyl esterase